MSSNHSELSGRESQINKFNENTFFKFCNFFEIICLKSSQSLVECMTVGIS